jgi:hypothetical protein
MSDIFDYPYNSLSKIAAVFIEGLPTCRVHYGFYEPENRSVLMVEGTGLYLRDVRCWLPDNISVKYGNTQDTIIFIDENVL